MKKNATIYDIAKECNLSIASISRIMNRTGSYSEKTRERVLLAMKRLNYTPNKSAQSLAGNNNRTLCFNLARLDKSDVFFEGEYILEVMAGVVFNASLHNFNVLITHKSANELGHSFFKENSIDGLILPDLTDSDEVINYYLAHDFPVSYIGQKYDFDNVGFNVYGGYKDYRKAALRYAHQKGFERVLIFDADIANHRNYFSGWNEDAIEEFYQENTGLSRDAFRVKALVFNDKKHFMQIVGHELAVKEPKPLIMTGGNDVAIDLYYYVTSLGLRIPDDVSIMSVCHRRDFGDDYHPALTTIFVNAREMGKRCVEKLVSTITKTGENISSDVDFELIERASVASPKT